PGIETLAYDDTYRFPRQPIRIGRFERRLCRRNLSWGRLGGGRRGPFRLGFDDLHRLHLVALLDLVHDVHPGDDFPEDRVLPVQKMGRRQRDVELAPRGIGVVAPRHAHAAADVRLFVDPGLALVARPAGPVTLRVAALDHETRLDAMERQ